MTCWKCNAEIPEGSVFCNICGKKQHSGKKHTVKSRGNGQGCAYQRPGQRTWTVEVVVGWKHPNGDPSKPKRPVRKTKGGFPSKKAALAYAESLRYEGDKRKPMTLEQVYLAWKEFYTPRVGASTMNMYYYAYKHFAKLHGVRIDKITSDDLQECMNNCPAGKRTHESMKTIAGLLWKYAIDKNIIDRNVTTNLFIGHGISVQRDPLTEREVATIKKSIGKERYAEYIYCLCWLGFRPGEFLELKKSMLFCANLAEKPSDPPMPVWYFVNGKKTEAGRDRIVIVPDEILSIVLDRSYVPGTDMMFPQYCFSREKDPKLNGFKAMSDAYFRKSVFHPMMERLGIAEGKVPYGARHTYADKLKNASGSDKDKAALIGHSNYLFTQDKYQSTHLKDLYNLVNSFSSESEES